MSQLRFRIAIQLFAHLGDNLQGLKLVQTVPTSDVIHLKFARE